MKCIEIEELITLYIDDRLDQHIKDMMEKHLMECNHCREEFESLLWGVDLCKGLPMLDLPKDFESDLHAGLAKAQGENNKKGLTNLESFYKRDKKIRWKIMGSVAAVFILLILSLSNINSFKMGSVSKQEMATEGYAKESRNETMLDKAESMPEAKMDRMAMDGGRGEIQYGMVAETDKSMNLDNTNGRKVIQNAFLSLDIENYDEKLNEIINRVTAIGGYIDHSNTQYKHYVPDKPEESLKIGELTARVPQDQFMGIINDLKDMGVVTNFNIGGQDITAQYRDTASEVENLKIQEKHLREIMEKAKDVKDILEVERELTRVRGQINSLTGNIKTWDDLVTLSTVSISLNEIVPKDRRIGPVSENIWEKAKKGFIQTVNHLILLWEKLFVGIISIIPIIIILSTIAIAVAWWIKKRKKQ